MCYRLKNVLKILYKEKKYSLHKKTLKKIQKNIWIERQYQTIYGFYCEKVAPTLDSLYVKLIKISKGTY